MAWSGRALPGLADPHRALAGYRTIPAQEVGGHREENAPALGQPRDAQVITESGGHGALFFAGHFTPMEVRTHHATKGPRRGCIVRRVVMSDASDCLTKWVRKNITPITAHIHNDTLTAGRLAEECLWEAQGENLNEAEVNEATGGNLLTFMVSALNRAVEQKIDEEGE